MGDDTEEEGKEIGMSRMRWMDGRGGRDLQEYKGTERRENIHQDARRRSCCVA